MNIEQFEDLQDKLAEQMEDANQIQEFFVNAAGREDDEELLDELDQLEADMAEEELDVEIEHGVIK